MAPSFRSDRINYVDHENGSMSVDENNVQNVPKGGMFERRRRRFKKDSRVDNCEDDTGRDESPDTDMPKLSGEVRRQQRRELRKQRKEAKKAAAEEELDPYDSDPGESYREHCEKHSGFASKSCLVVPKFLRNPQREIDSVLTAPPSPLASEMGEFSQIPASLPGNLTRVRYSLRSSITDGSEKQPTGPTVMERRDLRPNNVRLNVSHWSDAGGRPYMEDRYAIEDLDAVQVEVSPVAVKNDAQDVEVTYGPRKTKRITLPLSYFGIFDGHGGDKAAQFCADWLTAYIRNDKSYPYDLGYAMKTAFTTIDEDFVNTSYPDGCTACAVTMVGGRRIVCANAGDSRAIVVRKDGSIVRLSRDHKPGMPDETRRITELGGRVIYWGRWRVEGLLAVSRAIGDASLKPYITAEPEICEYDVGKDDLFLIMSSDGVWDVMDNEEAAHVVIASSCAMEDGKLKIDTDRFKWAARNLSEHARSCGSGDNFSVLVVDLKSCGNPAAESGRYEP